MLEEIPISVAVCAVTKGRSLSEVVSFLNDNPRIEIVAENRWPDCEQVFKWAMANSYKCHFIGHLQANKVRKVLPLVDMVQSVDSIDLLKKMNRVAEDLDKKVEFLIQVNVSNDQDKSGISLLKVDDFIESYLSLGLSNVVLRGLMTIGMRSGLEERERYFSMLADKLIAINNKYFVGSPLPYLSMGMSEDYQQAINAGSNMVRIGSLLFK